MKFMESFVTRVGSSLDLPLLMAEAGALGISFAWGTPRLPLLRPVEVGVTALILFAAYVHDDAKKQGLLYEFIHILFALSAIFAVELILPLSGLVKPLPNGVLVRALPLAAIALVVVRLMALIGLWTPANHPTDPPGLPAEADPYCKVCGRRHSVDPTKVAGCPEAAEWLTLIHEVDEKVRPAKAETPNQ